MGPARMPELFCRFVEFCSLWPRFVMNSWKDNGIVNLPWMHESVIPQVRDAITLRYRLMPYLYTQMWRASRENEPVVRPLFYDFPDDRSALDVQDSFMLGPDILVAPVLEEGASDRQVYLPEHAGGWFDFHDGRHFEGGQTITVLAPLGRLPVFVRCRRHDSGYPADRQDRSACRHAARADRLRRSTGGRRSVPLRG